jgi:hypothetical protein
MAFFVLRNLTRCPGSPPPCGEGLGVGGSNQYDRHDAPPSLTLPRKGGGDIATAVVALERVP